MGHGKGTTHPRNTLTHPPLSTHPQPTLSTPLFTHLITPLSTHPQPTLSTRTLLHVGTWRTGIDSNPHRRAICMGGRHDPIPYCQSTFHDQRYSTLTNTPTHVRHTPYASNTHSHHTLTTLYQPTISSHHSHTLLTLLLNPLLTP